MRRRMLVLGLAVVVLAGCSPAAGGGSSGGGRSGGGAPTIELTFSGDISGHTTQLDRSKKNDCSTDPYSFQLYPIVNGKTYYFSLLIGGFKGAGTYPANKVLVEVHLEGGNGTIGGATTEGTLVGSVVVNPDIVSGRLDFPDLSVKYLNNKLALTGTYRCPGKHA